ncbi:Chromosome partitioning ATPase, Mrp family, contains Fe-S cluster [Desulfacinum infernum DSM 9756]|uniref:Iron-sulfur cluster carrier protein n=1 Tax=Desulfacinum infernum DSM 9756 TaxID=1121391 RepID=A0A1M5G1A5_9BACT|nr:Mrp/NBP35 family ATP-binding protein [Desulfacinum infernum]SHF97508.1 Chromosome partitioning ATPase, Mrp family, contains Fe-S cluster [Desulfacinum infernum DSM 9756]
MASCEGKSCSTCEHRSKGTKDELLECKLSRIKHKIIVMSGKGGVGKSSVAVYIALALAKKGHRVGLMDIDLHGPSIPKMLGLHGLLRISKDQEILPHEYSPNLKVVSIESMLEDTDSAVIWRGPLKHGVIQQFISDCTWDDLDFLVVDCPPGTGDEPLSIARIIPDAKAVIVTTPQEVALADVRKSINFCKKVKLDIAGLVENMAGLYCPHCNEFIPIFRTGGGEKTAERMQIDFLGSLPFDPAVVVGGDQGRPILEDAESDSPFRKAVEALADAVVARFERNGATGAEESRAVH